MNRDSVLGVRLNELERQKLAALALRMGVSRADVVRLILAKAHDDLARGMQ